MRKAVYDNVRVVRMVGAGRGQLMRAKPTIIIEGARPISLYSTIS